MLPINPSAALCTKLKQLGAEFIPDLLTLPESTDRHIVSRSGKPPRPKNGWILYRQHFASHPAVMQVAERMSGRTLLGDISKILGAHWEALKLEPDLNAFWTEEQSEARHEHEQLYPGYVEPLKGRKIKAHPTIFQSLDPTTKRRRVETTSTTLQTSTKSTKSSRPPSARQSRHRVSRHPQINTSSIAAPYASPLVGSSTDFYIHGHSHGYSRVLEPARDDSATPPGEYLQTVIYAPVATSRQGDGWPNSLEDVSRLPIDNRYPNVDSGDHHALRSRGRGRSAFAVSDYPGPQDYPQPGPYPPYFQTPANAWNYPDARGNPQTGVPTDFEFTFHAPYVRQESISPSPTSPTTSSPCAVASMMLGNGWETVGSILPDSFANDFLDSEYIDVTSSPYQQPEMSSSYLENQTWTGYDENDISPSTSFDAWSADAQPVTRLPLELDVFASSTDSAGLSENAGAESLEELEASIIRAGFYL